MDDTRDRKIPPFFYSLVLHALIAALAYYLMTLEPETGGKSDPIQIDSIQTSPKKAPKHAIKPKLESTLTSHPSERSSPSTLRSSHQVSLSDLGMRLSTAPLPQSSEPSAPAESAYSPEAPDDTGWDIMNPDPKIARFNQYIYNTVQGWLDRDAYLNNEQIYGTVKVKIWFDGEGNYLENETVYEAMDPNFQKIVARALRKSFANPIPRPFLYIHKKFSIERMVVIRNHSGF